MTANHVLGRDVSYLKFRPDFSLRVPCVIMSISASLESIQWGANSMYVVRA